MKYNGELTATPISAEDSWSLKVTELLVLGDVVKFDVEGRDGDGAFSLRGGSASKLATTGGGQYCRYVGRNTYQNEAGEEFKVILKWTW